MLHNCPLSHLIHPLTLLIQPLNLSSDTESNLITFIILFALVLLLLWIYLLIAWTRTWVKWAKNWMETDDERSAREGVERWLFEDGRVRRYGAAGEGISRNSSPEEGATTEKWEGTGEETGAAYEGSSDEEKRSDEKKSSDERNMAKGESTTKGETRGILRNTSPGYRERSGEGKRVRFLEAERVSFKEDRTDQEWWLLEARGEKRSLFREVRGWERPFVVEKFDGVGTVGVEVEGELF